MKRQLFPTWRWLQSWRSAAVVLAVGLSAQLSGCALSPNLDAQFGEAVKNAQKRQALHTDPKLLQEDPDGLQGRAAAGVLERYFESYEQAPKGTGAAIGAIGGGSGQ